jgi:Flp pilus assembly protein TadD
MVLAEHGHHPAKEVAMKNYLLALSLLALLPSVSAAAEVNSRPHCHRLMTEAECVAHLNLIATLPRGEALEHYLDEFIRTKKEREAACACTPGMAHRATKPLQHQALLVD